MEYTVSVIIPTLNEEKFISRCLDSIISQSYSFAKMDVIVVDGGSNDSTRDIVKRYHDKYQNIRLLDNYGRIQSIAFNIGVKNSTAPYIIRLDAHALYKPFYIEACIEGLKSDIRRGNVGGQCDIKPQNNGLWATTNAILNYSKFGIGGAEYRIGAQAGNVDTVPFGSFPRKMIEMIGGMREDLPRGEDNEFNSRIRKAGYNIYFDPRIECIYYARPTLKASCKQMYANGESIGHLFYIDRDSIGLRHTIPLLFVLGIIFGIILSYIFHPIVYFYIVGLVVYCVCNILASLIACKKHGMKYFLPLIVMFFSVHVSYGWGTIVGLFTKWKLKKDLINFKI